jgi:hypothetical protein
MIRRKITGYVSDVDRMLETFDKTHAKSESHLAEMKKYQRIYQLRDKASDAKLEDKIWSEF